MLSAWQRLTNFSFSSQSTRRNVAADVKLVAFLAGFGGASLAEKWNSLMPNDIR